MSFSDFLENQEHVSSQYKPFSHHDVLPSWSLLLPPLTAVIPHSVKSHGCTFYTQTLNEHFGFVFVFVFIKTKPRTSRFQKAPSYITCCLTSRRGPSWRLRSIFKLVFHSGTPCGTEMFVACFIYPIIYDFSLRFKLTFYFHVKKKHRSSSLFLR